MWGSNPPPARLLALALPAWLHMPSCIQPHLLEVINLLAPLVSLLPRFLCLPCRALTLCPKPLSRGGAVLELAFTLVELCLGAAQLCRQGGAASLQVLHLCK